MTSEDIRNDYVFRTMEAIGREWSGEHSAYTIRQMADKIMQLQEQLAAIEAERDSQAHKASVCLRDWLRCAEANTAYSKEKDQWRVRVETAELERDEHKRERIAHAERMGGVVADLVTQIVRAERILAALRKPSEAVLEAATIHYGDVRDLIIAAVAAAEQGVQGER